MSGKNNTGEKAKNNIAGNKEENTIGGTIMTELREIFSDRVNVIIIVGTLIVGGGGVGGLIFYELHKQIDLTKNEAPKYIENTDNTLPSEIDEIRGKHKRILNESPSEKQEITHKEISAFETSPSTEQTIIPPKNIKDERKELMREEILSSGSATIGNNPEDIKNLADLINETLNGQKRK